MLGYHTLSASVLTLADLSDDQARKLPRYPHLPVSQLGTLAVDRFAKGQDLREHLLLDALNRSAPSSRQKLELRFRKFRVFRVNAIHSKS